MQPELHIPHPKYRADVDGLRAVAILTVLGFHAFPDWFEGGFVGVDIFFVISGFLISTIIFNSLESGRFNFIEFYSRRILRIFPSLLLVMTTCLVLGWFTLTSEEYKQLGKHIAGGAGFVSNYVLLNESGYFDNAAETKPLLHLWSLGIEEQYYLFWPLLLWAAHKKRFNLFTVTLVLALISFALSIRGVRKDVTAAFYSPQTRFWELLAGSMLAWQVLYGLPIADRLKRKLVGSDKGSLGTLLLNQWDNIIRNVGSLLGAILIASSLLLITKESRFPGWWALLPTLGAVLVIAAGTRAWINQALLSNRLLVWFGLISYPLYLWHWPLLTFARILFGDQPPIGLRVCIVLASVLLAWLTCKFIEKPIRFGIRRRIKPTVLAAFMVATGFIGYSVHYHEGYTFRPVAKRSMDFVTQPKSLKGYAPCDAANMSPESPLDMCLINQQMPPNAAIIGDSHAEDKFYSIVTNDPTRSWALLANNSCPPVLGILVEGSQKDCNVKFEYIFDWLGKNESIKTVVLSFYGNYFLTTSYAADHVRRGLGPASISISENGRPSTSRAETFFVGLDNAISYLLKHGKAVVVVVDIPELPWFPKDCVRTSRLNCVLDEDEVLERQKELRQITSRLKIKHPEITVYDPLPIFCQQGHCSYKSGDVVLYRDSHHLTLRGSDKFAKDLLQAMEH